MKTIVSSEEEGEVDDVTYKSPLSLHTQDELQAYSDDELEAKSFVKCLIKAQQSMLRIISSFICPR